VGKIFSEPRYASLRFTAEEVRGALVKAGCDYRRGFSKASAPLLRKAILALLDKDRRALMGLHLALSLPELVNAERYMDGWIVQSCAHMTTELENEANPFLFEMFTYGYDAMLEQQRVRDDAILSELGIDSARLKKMSPAEIDALCESFRNDPVKSAQIESVFAERFTPEEANAVADSLGAEVVAWLESDEAKPLLLSAAEVEPYVSPLAEMWDERVKAGTTTGKPGKKDFDQVFLPIIRQMAQAVFTPERKQHFIAKAKEYANELFAQGKKQVAGTLAAAVGPVDSAEPERDLS
jgi:hypothetical protein